MFCLSNERAQVIGIDTAYHKVGRFDPGWFNWLQERLVEGRAGNKWNILLSQNEAYKPGKPSPEELLDKDLDRLKSHVDLWFWGNTHYCGLYGPSQLTPFIGSCIGHAGYPYDRFRTDEDLKTPVAPLEWAETGGRFPEGLDLREDRGSNGFCVVEIGDRNVRVVYYDWMRRVRCERIVVRKDTGYVDFAR